MRKMKKLFIALAIAGASVGGAHAQSAVEIYGVVDMGFVAESGTTPTATTKVTPVNKLTSGVQSGTRLGFKGTENLGDGMKALFVLETGIAADAGGFNQGNTAFARQSFVGLQSDLGTLTLGRQYTPLFNTMLIADPFAAGMAGAGQNLLVPAGNIRSNNTVKYTSPVFGGGFTTEIAYGLGEAVDNSSKGHQSSAALNYSANDLKLSLAYSDWSVVGTTTNLRKDWFLAANYDLQIAKIFAGITDTSDATITGNALKSNDYLIGAQLPVGKHTFIASYINKDVRNAANRDANMFAVGYTYAFSKRTNLYAAWGRIDNDSLAGFAANRSYTVGNNSELGTGEKAFNFGLRHLF